MHESMHALMHASECMHARICIRLWSVLSTRLARRGLAVLSPQSGTRPAPFLKARSKRQRNRNRMMLARAAELMQEQNHICKLHKPGNICRIRYKNLQNRYQNLQEVMSEYAESVPRHIPRIHRDSVPRRRVRIRR